MMTSTQVRQSFLDFFKSKSHTIVPSSSLMPDSPNLLFTNAGMNQFVPIFLGQTKCPYTPGRAADTQKCIRAGGKHNDLDDVGLDTYHHTFFEMLGNWSFGDYFKQEAIAWAWELVIEVWKFPPQRIYATIYQPEKSKQDPAERDEEAYNFWAEKFRSVGLDPAIHIVNGNKKDNFWMMGETGPCGPCTEIHVDLRPGPVQTELDAQISGAKLVNGSDARCIEIWNNVFIQYNANPDGTFTPLPAQHVDTGMGFERVTSIIQGTKGLTDFQNAKISNYETDIFRPIFDVIEKLSGKKYSSTLPTLVLEGEAPAAQGYQQSVDIAFRVIADHIRTLSFAIADGIQPGNNDRNYVLRRILRRAVRYGRTLGFHEPFFHKLVDVLADTMGDVFPEIRAKKKNVQETIQREEEAFNKTLDRGIALFNEEVASVKHEDNPRGKSFAFPKEGIVNPYISGEFAFKLYDTYGFPLDLTELMAREGQVGVDKEEFEKLMEEQRARARAAQKKEIISLSQIETTIPTKFVGYEKLGVQAKVLEVVTLKDKTAVILDTSACYAEMGGQVGDSGWLTFENDSWPIVNTQKSGNTWLHILGTQAEKDEHLDIEDTIDKILGSESKPRIKKTESEDIPIIGSEGRISVNKRLRRAIERHHTVTHLLHWALHEVVEQGVSQKGSFVGPEKLTFDFNSAPLTPKQIESIERIVNKRILENAGVSWTEVAHADVKNRKDVMQFFGDKYGDTVRVVQIGGGTGKLDGYSMELCGGTHTRATGEIGLFRIVSEAAVAAGVRRIEAVAGLTAYDAMKLDREVIKTVAGKVNSPVHELEKKIESLLAHQKALEKEVLIALQRNASNAARELLGLARSVNDIPFIVHNLGDANGDFLQAIADALKGRFQGVVVLGGGSENSVSLVATVSAGYTAKVQAGKIIQAIAPIVGGKGGGKPDHARGGGKDATKLDEALAKAKTLLG
jgi:alanyl-tRNA synthetase